MANEFFTILTATGRSKLARAVVENTPLALTHMAVGSGNNEAYYTPSEAQTSLKQEVWRGPLNNLSVSPDNPNWIVAECVIPDNVGGFYIREMGLFDTAGTLIAVGRFPESYKPTLVDGSNKQLYVRMILEVSNTASVTLLVDQSIALATHQYVDNKITSELQKLDRKESVRIATTSQITLSGLQTIDGIALASGDRVLVKNQSSAKENGIYVSSSDAWARAADANTSSKVTPGLSVPVEEGTENADSVWMLVTDGRITLGTTALEFDWVGKRGLAPITSPGFKGVPTAPTPVQFDNTTKLATTEFIRQALGSFSGQETYTESVILSSSDAGKRILATGGAGVIVTLPFLSNIPIGTKLYIRNVSPTEKLSIQCQGSDSLTVMSGNVITNFSLPAAAFVVATSGHMYWCLEEGDAALKHSSLFNASLTSSGYQKLPSGLIIQWGSIFVAPSSTGTVTYPIAFPNEMLAVFATNGFATYTATNTPFVGIVPTNTRKVSATVQNGYSASANTINWFAIGN